MKTRPSSDWNIFIYFLRYLKPVWRLMLLVLVMAVIITTLDINTVILPLLIRKFIDQVLGQQDWHVFWMLVVVILVQIVLYFTFSLIYELVKYVVSMRLGIRLGMDVFKHVMKLPLSFFQKRPIGEHMYRIGSNFDPGFANLAILGMLFELTGTAKSAQQPMVGKDVDGVLGMLTQSLDLLVRVLFRLALILFTIAIGFSAQVGVALLIFCIPYIWVIHRFYNVQRNIDFKYRAKSQSFLAGLQEWFAGIKTIKAFGKGRSETRKNTRLYVSMLRVEWQNYFMKLVTDDFIFLFRYLFIVAALFYVAVQQRQTAGAIFGLYLLLDQFFSPINLMIRVFEGIRLQLIPSRRLMDTLTVEPTIRERENAVAMDSFSGSYAIDQVSFSYVPEKEVLSEITIHTEPGKKVAIVGPSGSGKTSLVNLLLRFYDPARGEILADRVDLRNVKSASYYRHIGIILQEDFLFSGTVRDNIRYGKPDATETEIIDAAKLAAIHDDILSLPGSYDTDLAEGSKLSGGQRQRIAIARALIRKPSVLVLDEATSALDSQTAATIDATLNRVCAEKTVIVITHRLDSVRDCDEIFVLNKGRLVEQGSFHQLLMQNGLFASLYQKQVQV